MPNTKKIIVYVPLTHTDIVREAIGQAGAGKIGKYSFCSFSTRGVGRFKPEAGAQPHIGTVGKGALANTYAEAKLEEVEEERIEVTCEASNVAQVISAIRKVHPYEEVALDVYPLENYPFIT